MPWRSTNPWCERLHHFQVRALTVEPPNQGYGEFTIGEDSDVNPQASTIVDSDTYVFSARELARLEVYKAAVTAGFYDDQCLPLEPSSRPEAAALDAHGLLESIGEGC